MFHVMSFPGVRGWGGRAAGLSGLLLNDGTVDDVFKRVIRGEMKIAEHSDNDGVRTRSSSTNVDFEDGLRPRAASRFGVIN